MKTLAIDIGGTGLKASVLDEAGTMLVDRVRVPTPHPSRPKDVMAALDGLVKQLPAFDRISAGFPGVVREGKVITAPHLGTKQWAGYDLQAALTQAFGKPARVENDAEVQGLGVITGKGLEVVLTLGTGIGSSIFSNGRMTPHLELAHHPIHKSATYDEYIGDAVRKKIGKKKWNVRVRRAIDIVNTLLNYDTLYLGGGNAANVTGKLPPNVQLASNEKGITGGIHLWDEGRR
ncbi:MAG: ROK family protein [Proteobacteria bacterium]|nr:ROK family protein [Pseudomonadota bacterium]